jgi:16S rRNA (guanine527-N7)-methyltransferase
MSYNNNNVLRGTIDQYIELLTSWNKKINLVSFKSKEELINRHILDSLQLMDYIKTDQEVFDIGSGAGFPGLIISYAGIKSVNLVEKIEKKANFLAVASSLTQNKIKIYNQSVEEIRKVNCDVITARGFADLESIFNLTKNITNKDTKYILQKGKNIGDEVKNALKKWSFTYIIHQSKTSDEGCVLEVEHLKENEQKNYSNS